VGAGDGDDFDDDDDDEASDDLAVIRQTDVDFNSGDHSVVALLVTEVCAGRSAKEETGGAIVVVESRSKCETARSDARPNRLQDTMDGAALLLGAMMICYCIILTSTVL